MSSSPSLHLLAERPRPAVVGIPPNDFTCGLVDLHPLAELPKVERRVVNARVLGIDLVDVGEQALDCLHQSLVGRALCQNQRLDHGGVHRARRVRFQDWQPIASGEVVPCRRGVAVHRGQDPGCRFGRLGHGAGRGVRLIPTLPLLAGRRPLLDGSAELLDEAGREVSILLPQPNKVLELPDMLRAVVEGRGGADQSRQSRLQLAWERLVSAAELDVVEDVVEDVQNMQPATLSRRSAAPRGLGGLGGILLWAKRLGQGDQVLAEGSNAGGRGQQVREGPLLAFLGRRRTTRTGLADGST